MRKLASVTLVALAAMLFAPAAFAQDTGGEAASPAQWIVITAGFGMALAAAVCGFSQAKVASAACEGMARNPGAAGAIRLAMILGLVFIETLALFTLLVVFVKI